VTDPNGTRRNLIDDYPGDSGREAHEVSPRAMERPRGGAPLDEVVAAMRSGVPDTSRVQVPARV